MVTGSASRWIAVIPARGGSKRIPNKNVVDFCGRPMMAWTVDAAISCGLFDSVIVSTDSERVAEAGREAGASIPFLRSAYADDDSPVSAATIWTISELERRSGIAYEVVVQLMPNCPFRSANDITQMAKAFSARNVPAMLSCSRFRFQNPWWAFSKASSGRTEAVAGAEQRSKRSQDLSATYSPTGAIWIARTSNLIADGSFYCDGHVMEEISWISGIDIDDPEELEIARMLGAVTLRDTNAGKL